MMECSCGSEGPDQFGNYEQIEDPHCPIHGASKLEQVSHRLRSLSEDAESRRRADHVYAAVEVQRWAQDLLTFIEEDRDG